MAGNLDKALLQMAGFEDEGDLYAKAAASWFYDDHSGENYFGRTGENFQYLKDKQNDAANWGFKNRDARLNALLYAWAKDNPKEVITPEVIKRLDYLASTADSMNVSGRRFWQNGAVSQDEHVKGLIDNLIKNPTEANKVLKEKGFNYHDSAVQNYFDWASQFMDDDTVRDSITRNVLGGHFADELSLASRNLGNRVSSAITDSNYGLSEEEIAKKSKLAEAKKKVEEEEAKRLQDAEDLENLRRAGFGHIIDNPNYKSTIPEEWL